MLESYTYAYDAASNLTQETDNGTPVTYAYNTANEVTVAGAASFSYDATGNRNSSGYTTGTGNEMTVNGVYTYSYDHAGNQTGKTNTSTGEFWVFVYDDKNELTSVVDTSTGGTITSTYEYDAFGNRIEQSVVTASTTTVTKYAMDGWDPALAGSTGNSRWNVWADLSSGGSLQTRYVWGGQVNQLFARISSGGTAAFVLTDHLGSIVGVTNASGTLEDVVTYGAYGNITNETNSSWGGTFKYTATQFDSTTELYFSRARYYDATAGRWISQDPLGFDAGESNLYRYVNNRPTYWTDPSGLQQREAPVTNGLGFGMTAVVGGGAEAQLIYMWDNQGNRAVVVWVGAKLGLQCGWGGQLAPIAGDLPTVISNQGTSVFSDGSVTIGGVTITVGWSWGSWTINSSGFGLGPGAGASLGIKGAYIPVWKSWN